VLCSLVERELLPDYTHTNWLGSTRFKSRWVTGYPDKYLMVFLSLYRRIPARHLKFVMTYFFSSLLTHHAWPFSSFNWTVLTAAVEKATLNIPRNKQVHGISFKWSKAPVLINVGVAPSILTSPRNNCFVIRSTNLFTLLYIVSIMKFM
jgi:hypothetical protein